jgi:hypothetical protein
MACRGCKSALSNEFGMLSRPLGSNSPKTPGLREFACGGSDDKDNGQTMPVRSDITLRPSNAPDLRRRPSPVHRSITDFEIFSGEIAGAMRRGFFAWGRLRSGNIPQVTWIVPPSFVSEHPDWLPAAGEHCTQLILAALWSNPELWARTALILHFDENDGQFDHVTPPTPTPGIPDEYVGGLPIGLGFRVPCLVISPWPRGWLCFQPGIGPHLIAAAPRGAVWR